VPNSSRRRAATILSLTAASALAVAGGLVASAPAYAALPPVTDVYTDASNPTWVVPAGVHSIEYRVVGGPGGNGSGEHGGLGGDPIEITGTLFVEPGWELDIYVGQAGTDGGGTGGTPGVGGAGYRSGGDGGTSGNAARPGAGGGGSSAIEVEGAAVVVAGGAGGGGGRGQDDDIVLDACYGGTGGDSGAIGSGGTGPAIKCGTSNPGAAGLDVFSDGSNATNVPGQGVLSGYYLAGGGGGGGAGSGGPGTYANADGPLGVRNAGGGGGAGGASLVPPDATTTILVGAESGVVELTYAIEYLTIIEAVAAPNPAAPGEKVTVTATVANIETNDDPTGTVDFSIPGCEAVALVDGTAGDGESTATCTYTAGDPGTVVYGVWYTPPPGSPFAPSDTEVEVVVAKVLPATGAGESAALIGGGAAVLLLLGGMLIALRRRAA